MHDDLQLPIAFFTNIGDNRVEDVSVVTWGELKELLSTPDLRDDKDGPLFQVVLYKEPDDETIEPEHLLPDGTLRRVGDNIAYYFALHLDFDDGPTMNDVRKLLLPYEHCGYTSHNHWKTYGVQKFRVILPLAEPITVAQLRERRDAILKWLNGVDPSTLAIGRCFYLPSCSKNGKLFATSWANNGSLLDVLNYFEPKKEPLAPVNVTVIHHGNEDERRTKILQELLKLADNGVFASEDQWFKLGGALHADGYSVSDYKMLSWPTAHDACEKRWKRWNSSPPPMNGGYLINLIRNNGNPTFMLKGSSPKKTGTTLPLILNRKGKSNV